MPLSSEQRSQIKSFGANMRRERTARKLTQEKLAEKADLFPRTIQKIEAAGQYSADDCNSHPEGAGLFLG